MRNDSAAGVTGIIVSVSLFGSADRTLETSLLLQQPLQMLVNAPLLAGYSLDYEIRLKNLSLESACMSEVVVVAELCRRRSLPASGVGWKRTEASSKRQGSPVCIEENQGCWQQNRARTR
jgi:hypothetical protein